MSTSGPYIAYGDLNCPFCFVLHRRLADLGVSDAVEWRLVQHEPDLPLQPGRATEQQLAALRQEVASLAQRAPDVPVQLPAERPSSGPGTRAVAEVGLVDAAAGRRLMERLFFELWQHRQDIASEAVVRRIAREVGVTALPRTLQGELLVRSWQEGWIAGDYQRIPVLVSPYDSVFLGLNTLPRLRTFMESGRFDARADGVC